MTNFNMNVFILKVVILFAAVALTVSASITSPGTGSRIVNKKSFSSVGCLGTYDRSKFARLDRICDECFQIYRDTQILSSCREFCFKNDVFPACVDALLLSTEQKELNQVVDEMLG